MRPAVRFVVAAVVPSNLLTAARGLAGEDKDAGKREIVLLEIHYLGLFINDVLLSKEELKNLKKSN